MKRAWLAGAVVVAVAAGCTSDEGAPDGEAGASSAPEFGMESAVRQDLALPEESLSLDPQQAATLARAEAALVADCMGEQGFDYDPPSMHGSPDSDVLTRRYALVYDEDVASEFGYHVASESEQQVQEAPQAENTMSDAALEALIGDGEPVEAGEVPPGCRGEGTKQLLANAEVIESGFSARPRPVVTLSRESYAKSKADARVVDAVADWVSCMAEGGYNIEDPWDHLPPEMDITTPKPTQAEIEMALHDVRCQQRTGYVELWNETEAKMQQEMIDETPEVFAQIQDEHAALLKRAAEVLEGSDG